MPSCLTDLFSFMGLINPLVDFMTRVNTIADPLRELLKTKNEFRWTETHNTVKPLYSEQSRDPKNVHYTGVFTQEG